MAQNVNYIPEFSDHNANLFDQALNNLIFNDKSFKNRPESFLFVLINVKALMSC